MTVRLVALAFDAIAPRQLARFWAHALRWNIQETGEEAVTLLPADATSFHVLFRPGGREKVSQNRIHFDLTTASTEDQDTTVAELLALGATHVDVGQDANDTHVVLADPEGNEFCIIAPDNRFLAGCPRLGAVNCDGTRALGRFFSEAFGWPLVWDQDEETAIQAPDGAGPKITWSGPPLRPRSSPERFHFHVAPAPGTTTQAAVGHVLALGAARRDGGRGCPGAMALADVDGNEFCLVEA